MNGTLATIDVKFLLATTSELENYKCEPWPKIGPVM